MSAALRYFDFGLKWPCFFDIFMSSHQCFKKKNSLSAGIRRSFIKFMGVHSFKSQNTCVIRYKRLVFSIFKRALCCCERSPVCFLTKLILNIKFSDFYLLADDPSSVRRLGWGRHASHILISHSFSMIVFQKDTATQKI